MKKIIVSIILSFVAASSFAQDIILKNNTEEILAKVEEISETEIRYRLWDYLDGPIRVIKTSEVFRIKFSNGDIEVFNTTKSSDNVENQVFAPSSKSYKVGDVYRENGLLGVVVNVTGDGHHGLIMHPEPLGKIKEQVWCVKSLRKKGAFVGATDKNDGMANMKAVENYITANHLDWSHFPAFLKCRELGDGWYLPAEKEVEMIFRAANNGFLDEVDNRYKEDFDKTLKQIGGDWLSDVMSSTEVDAKKFVGYYIARGCKIKCVK